MCARRDYWRGPNLIGALNIVEALGSVHSRLENCVALQILVASYEAVDKFTLTVFFHREVSGSIGAANWRCLHGRLNNLQALVRTLVFQQRVTTAFSCGGSLQIIRLTPSLKFSSRAMGRTESRSRRPQTRVTCPGCCRFPSSLARLWCWLAWPSSNRRGTNGIE